MAKRKKHRKPSVPPIPVGRDPIPPTDQRMKRGEWAEAAIEKGGPRVHFDRASSPLEAAYVRGVISEAQVNAGRKLEALARKAMGGGSRSCLDFSPRGSGGQDGAGVAVLQLRAALVHAGRAVAHWEAAKRPAVTRSYIEAETHGVLLSVCWEGDGIGDCRMDRRRFRFLSCGLTALADFWGMQDRRRMAAE